MPKKEVSKKDWTTLIVQKTTRDMVNRIAKGNDLTQDEVILNFINTHADATKQIVTDLNHEKYAMLGDVAKFLYDTKCTKQPDINTAVRFAIDNLIDGVAKSVQGKG